MPAGSATDYAAVPAGSWDLALTGAYEAATSAVDLPAGSVSTVFVLEGSEQGGGPREGLSRSVAVLREVRVGSYGEDAVEILGGVRPGELVATSTQHALADAVPVEFEPPAPPGPLAQAH